MNPAERFISECCVEYRFGEGIDTATSDRVLGAYTALRELERDVPGILDVVPSYNALCVHLDPGSPLLDDAALLRETIAGAQERPLPPGRCHTLDVCYDGEDLEAIARATGLTPGEVAALHAGKPYRIAMLGFRPYFPYLLGLDPRLNLPRRASPRTRVPSGSVAIAAGQTGVYPEASPGGWHLIGRTAFTAFETLMPGDTVVFRSIPC